MKSEMDKMMKRNNERFGVIKNIATSLQLHVFHSPVMSDNVENSVYWTSGDYRAHVNETEYRKAAALAESRKPYVSR